MLDLLLFVEDHVVSVWSISIQYKTIPDKFFQNSIVVEQGILAQTLGAFGIEKIIDGLL